MDIERNRKARVLGPFLQYLDCPWVGHFASVERKPTGGVRATLFLETQPCHDLSCGHSHCSPVFGAGVLNLVNVAVCYDESDSLDRNDCKRDIEKLKVGLLLDHLIESVFLSLQFSKGGNGDAAE